MKVRIPAALAVVAIGASCAAVIAALYGGGWFHDIEAEGEIEATVTKVEPSEPEAPVIVKKIEKLEIDVEGQRVLLPGDGWISAPEFWDIYYNYPHKLPGEIDFAKLQQLEILTEAARAEAEGGGDPPQQPETSDQILDLAQDPTRDPAQDSARDPVWDPARNQALDSTLNPA